MNIKEASFLTGISRDMLRYYEKLGILFPRRSPGNNYRDYSITDINNAVMIKQYSSLGISLKSLAEIFRQGNIDTALEELGHVVRSLENNLEWAQARLGNAKDFYYLFQFIQQNKTSDTGISPVSYYYRRPHPDKPIPDIDPGLSGAFRMIFRISPENTVLPEYPTDQGILTLRKIPNSSLPYIEIPPHRYWRTVFREEADGIINRTKLNPLLHQMIQEGHTLHGNVILYQILNATKEHPEKLVCVECDVGPV